MDPVREAIRPDAADGEKDAARVLAFDKVVAFERGRLPAADPILEAESAPRPDARPLVEPTAKRFQAPAPAVETAPPRKKRRARIALPVILLAVLGGGGWYGHEWWTNGRFFVSTDDAYVQADIATLGTKVAGYIADVKVRDGDKVAAGDIVATLDDTDFRLALSSALAKRETQTATIARIDRQIAAQAAQIESSRAAVTSAQAESTRAAGAYERAQSLAKQSFQTKAALDQAIADRDRALAAIASAKAMLSAAEANLDVVKAQKTEAEQVARELDTAIDRARSDLAFTVIRAPSDGVIGNRAAQPGQYVSPGARLMALVPMKSVFVAANFKETQLAGLRAGQEVDLEVDSLPGRTIKGRIESIAPASGSTFSLLPPENATGNFTKITQRVPVRVEVPAEIASAGVLRPGLSVVASVDTRT
jgi:membrane fusion protein (multidrug efflux system)